VTNGISSEGLVACPRAWALVSSKSEREDDAVDTPLVIHNRDDGEAIGGGWMGIGEVSDSVN
jgi:hypothetical protein